MRNSIEDTEKIGDKLSESDQSTIKEAVEDALSWLSSNPEATKDEYQDKLKEIEKVCNPIMAKIYEGAGHEDYGSHDDL